MSQKIKPYLWFDNQAEEAATFYVSLFDDSRIVSVQHNSEGWPGEPGTVLLVEFELKGQTFVALNGGPTFRFTEAVSFMIDCADQAEVDFYWDKLIADGGEPSACGWLKDKYGLSWQVIPRRLPELLGDPDPGRARRAVEAMLQMSKIDLAEIERAADAA